MKEYNFTPSDEAENDVYEAYEWYEQQRTGLGEEFLKSVDSACQSILQNPIAYRVRYKKKVRAFLLDRFPYLILYIVEKKEISVIAVFHTSRDPKTWKERIE